MNWQVLLLDSTFEPLRIIDWRDAMRMVFNGKATILAESEQTVRSYTSSWKLPSVLLQKGKFQRHRGPTFSRTNVFIRDQFTCQYCSGAFGPKKLTMDHVFPKCRGGKKTWTNIVTACHSCNQKKNNRTPEEAKMRLLMKPKRPDWLPAMAIKLRAGYSKKASMEMGKKVHKSNIPEQWMPYLKEEDSVEVVGYSGT